VRRAFEPVLESPVTIRDADRAIGTHVFTAVGRAGRPDDPPNAVTRLLDSILTDKSDLDGGKTPEVDDR
jgi:hypothetical protein